MIKNPIVPIQRGKLPSFVRAEYPSFERYMVDYFKWLESDGNFVDIVERWKYNTDVTHEVEPYVSAFLKDLGWNWSGNVTVDKKLLISILKDFYLSRGTKKSFDFLFKLLFNEEVHTKNPREKLLIPSQADYVESFQVFTTATSSNELDTIVRNISEGEPVTVTGILSGVQAQVEKAYLTLSGGITYLNIYITPVNRDFIVKEDVKLESPYAISIQKFLNIMAVNVLDPGSGISVGDRMISSEPKIEGVLRVKSILGGGISSVSITSPGDGYQVGEKVIAIPEEDSGFGFFGRVKTIDGTGGITSIEVLNRGYGYKQKPILVIKTELGQAGVVAPVSGNIGGIGTFSVLEPYVDFDPGSVSLSLGNASFEIVEASVFRKKSFKDRSGVLGENSTLIDSDRYQQFSYDIISSVPRKFQGEIVDQLLHPTGYVKTTVLSISEESLKVVTKMGSTSKSQKEPTVFVTTLSDESIITLGYDALTTL